MQLRMATWKWCNCCAEGVIPLQLFSYSLARPRLVLLTGRRHALSNEKTHYAHHSSPLFLSRCISFGLLRSFSHATWGAPANPKPLLFAQPTPYPPRPRGASRCARQVAKGVLLPPDAGRTPDGNGRGVVEDRSVVRHRTGTVCLEDRDREVMEDRFLSQENMFFMNGRYMSHDLSGKQ